MMRGATHGETEVKRRRFNEKSSKIKGPRASGVPPERLWARELLQNTLEPNSDGFLVDLGSPWGGHFRLEFAQGCKKDVQKLLFLVIFSGVSLNLQFLRLELRLDPFLRSKLV